VTGKVVEHEQFDHDGTPAQRVAVAVVAASDDAVVDDGQRLLPAGGEGRRQELLDEGLDGSVVVGLSFLILREPLHGLVAT